MSLIEHSVTIITFSGWLSLTYFIIPLVEPAKSDAWITSGGHSGCAIILIPGLAFLISFISSSLNCSWTSQVPFHDIISVFVCEATYLAKKSSGKNITFLTLRDSTILTAFADVQHTSVSAFTSAEVFT